MSLRRALPHLAGGLALAGLVGCATPRSHFEQTDTNKNGKLDVSELKEMLTQVVYATADKDRDAKVTFAEIEVVDDESDADEFRVNDADGSGDLSYAEMKAAIERHGGFDELMSMIDADGSGVIDPTEAGKFHDAMLAAEEAEDFKQLEAALKS